MKTSTDTSGKQRLLSVLGGALVVGLYLCLLAGPTSRNADAEDGVQAPDEGVVFPLIEPRLSSTYGPRRHPVKKYNKHHNGVDLAAPKNSHVRAVKAGLVIFADAYAGFGKLVTIQHSDGYVSLYGHLNDILVNPGQKVAAGELLGRVGSTGLATGPHLHFEWRKDGQPVDPLKVFPFLAEDAEG